MLDGTDAQARTQIGTPYYLSPEICESKPYGRSSDMWSLGVVLFELMALELPFTAQSLPALVIKICTADPKWEKVEDTYSTANIELCQALLLKDCAARPTVRELLKSDYLMVHISKLLSHTIKMGKGGAEGAVLGGTNVDEVDRNIERERTRQKANEKLDKENEKLALRHAQHEEDREKLRKFKQNQARQKKRLEKEEMAAGGDTVVHVPVEKAGVMEKGNVERSQSDVEEALAQAARREELRLKEQQEQYERKLQEQQQKHQEELRRNQLSQQRDDRDRDREAPSRSRPSSGESSSRRRELHDQYDRDRDREMDRDRDRDRGGYRDGHRDNRGHYQQQSHHIQQQRSHQSHIDQHDGYMVAAKPKPLASGAGEGGEEMSAARREFFANRAAAQQIKAKVEAYERGGSKRGASRNVSSGMELALGGGGQYQQQSSHPTGEYRHQQPRRQHGHSHHEGDPGYHEDRALSGEERIAQVKAQRRREQDLEAAEKERQLRQAYEETHRERMRIEALRKSNADGSPSRNITGGRDGRYDDDRDRGRRQEQEQEQEVSHYDRQRKRELQKLEANRKHEQLLQDARAHNRRKSNEGAVAFSIDFNDNANDTSDSAAETLDGGSPRREKGGSNRRKPQEDNRNGPSEQFRSRSNSEVSESESSVNTTSSTKTSSRQRKGWGAPIAPPRAKMGLSDTDSEANEVPDGTAVRQLYGTSLAQEVEDDEEAVLKCLEARNGREEAARGHAKEVFRKLREKQRREAKLSQAKSKAKGSNGSGSSSSAGSERRRSDPRPPTRPPPNKIASDNTPPRSIPRKKSNTRINEKPVNSDIEALSEERDLVMKKSPARPKSGDKRIEEGGGFGNEDNGVIVVNNRHASPSSNLARLNDVMGQVAKAQEEVSKVIADARDSNSNNRGGGRISRGSRSSLEKDVVSSTTAPSTHPRDSDIGGEEESGLGDEGESDYPTGKSTSSTQKTTVRNSYGRTGQRLSLGDDEIFAYSSGDDSDEGNHPDNHERELEKTLDSWLSKDTMKSKKSEMNLLKSMKKGNSMKSLKNGGASMKELALCESSSSKEVLSEANSAAGKDGGEAKATAEAKVSPRLTEDMKGGVGGASMKSVAHVDERFDGIESSEEDNEDEDEEQEDGAVVGLQLLLAKALLSEDSNVKLNGNGEAEDRDDISL